MWVVYTADHAQHHPPYEVIEGRNISYYETPQRVEIIRAALEIAQIGPIISPRYFGLNPVLAIHDATYIAYLEQAYARWIAAGYTSNGVIPDIWPGRSHHRRPVHPLAEAGIYCYDLSAVIGAGTYAAARAAADVALTGAALLLEGHPAVYALCRPPGHHAARAMCGGYCFLNNAAIALQYLLKRDCGDSTVESPQSAAILDIDVHHGNGTQEIFYERADVFCVSIHMDPTHEYPFFWGYADERGAGPGVGYTMNFPLEAGVTNERFLTVLDQALATIRAFAPHWLVVSVGFDTFESDPLGTFCLTRAVYSLIGARIAMLGLPTLFIQEGGYVLSELGTHVVELLQGFMQATG